MALVIKKIVDLYFYLNDEISGEFDLNQANYRKMILIFRAPAARMHILNGAAASILLMHFTDAHMHFSHIFLSLDTDLMICFYVFSIILDPRVRDMLFMSNPFSMFGILVCYLYFILKWGPKFMKNRKPFNLNKLIIVYNIIQILACARLVVHVNTILIIYFLVLKRVIRFFKI